MNPSPALAGYAWRSHGERAILGEAVPGIARRATTGCSNIALDGFRRLELGDEGFEFLFGGGVFFL